MHIPGNLPAALGHAERRPGHRLESPRDVHHGDDQILLCREILYGILPGKIQVEIGLSAGFRFLQHLLDRALIKKHLEAPRLQLFLQLICGGHLILVQQRAKPRRFQPLHVDDHDFPIFLRRQGQHVLVLVFHKGDGPVGNLLLHGLVLRASHDFLQPGLRRD